MRNILKRMKNNIWIFAIFSFRDMLDFVLKNLSDLDNCVCDSFRTRFRNTNQSASGIQCKSTLGPVTLRDADPPRFAGFRGVESS